MEVMVDRMTHDGAIFEWWETPMIRLIQWICQKDSFTVQRCWSAVCSVDKYDLYFTVEGGA